VLGLPGSFGRYLERYRQRGELRSFLRRATAWTASLTAAAAVLLVVAAGQFSALIFGRSDRRTLVLLLAVSLVAIITHHFLEALYAALRNYRVVSAMHFCQSMTFAIASLTLLVAWRAVAESIVIGYGAACLVSSLGAIWWQRRALADAAGPGGAPPHAQFWPPLLRFAVWVWVTNLLCHLFAVIDRYMLVHYSGLESAQALALVGHYHAGRIVPLLFLSVADLLAGVVLPYLSHDWEAGQRERVAERLNLVLKCAACAMMAGGVAALAAAPLLFQIAFDGRYGDGLAVLPATLTYCIWYGLLLIGQTYLWCAERIKAGTLPLACGLIVNTLLNLALIPLWGLAGAVAATTLATGLSLAVLYALNRRAGMNVSAGVLWLSLAPAALCGGLWTGVLALAALTIVLTWSKTLVTPAERRLLGEQFGKLRGQAVASVNRFRKVQNAVLTSQATN
jgi:O-antigen/teichoic acid export membrane protein